MITIVPNDSVVLIEGRSAYPVEMDSVDPNIHAIQFNPQLGNGFIEYIPDERGIIPPLEVITSLSPWGNLIEQAENIFFCQDNPKTYYRTTEPVGSPVVVRSEGWPQPPDTSELEPPLQPSSNSTLYWNGVKFVWSCFPLDMDLKESQEYICSQVNQTAYEILLTTDWMVVREVETSVKMSQEVKDWRENVRSEAKSKVEIVREISSTSELQIYCESLEFSTWPTLTN